MGSTAPRIRQGPVRARVLARQRLVETSDSATAWLKGSHEAIVLHPEWQQLQDHLRELTAAAVRSYLGEACPQAHPHAIEAARQICGGIFGDDEAREMFPGRAQPHLLNEPYISEEGAAGMLRQTLGGVLQKVDMEAEAHGTLESAEFRAFRALVSSVYVGSLQKRLDRIENRERLQQQQQQQQQQQEQHEMKDDQDIRAVVGARVEKGKETQTTRGPAAPKAAEEGVEKSSYQNKRQDGARMALPPSVPERQNSDSDSRGQDIGLNAGGDSGGEDGGGNIGGDTVKPEMDRVGHQACSGDIAQALVAMATGGGFEGFSSYTSVGVTGGSSGRSNGLGQQGTGVTRKHAPSPPKGRFGRFGRVGKGVEGLSREVGGNNGGKTYGVAQLRIECLEQAADGLRYLSENDPGRSRERGQAGGLVPGTIEGGSGSVAQAQQFPGLEWLAPHIIGRSIPMQLRRELWQRTLLIDDGGRQSPAEVQRLITRFAREKGIVDPTRTPIAGMVATGVRHRAVDVFPWLSRGGKADLDLRKRACSKADQLLNQYFVFVGKHDSRHVAPSLLLSYVFSMDSAAVTTGGGGTGSQTDADSMEAATLVAMLHSLLTRFAPDAKDVRGEARTRAYEEIQKRDPTLFEHLNAMFPAYKYGGVGEENEDDYFDDGETSDGDDAPASTTVSLGCESKHPPGLVETWLGDAFVGYLREDAVLFVWDHLFLLGWREQLPLFVADMAIHLRASLLRATSPLTLLSMARDACRRIYTRDVREAFRRRRTEGAREKNNKR